MAGPALSADFERRFDRGSTIRAAFSLPLEPPETLVLFGPSGAGKTTILRALAGLERPDAGRIECGSEPWFSAERRLWLAPQRRNVGYLAQGFALFPHLSVEGNLAYGMSGVDRANRVTRVRELVTTLGLEGLERRRPAQLSGGEQQRVALGRALARRPRLLLLDEPLSALDAPTREALRGELRRLLRAAETPAVLVTHDRTEALVLGDRVAIVADGTIRQAGTVEEVFDRPADEAVARIVGIETVVRGVVTRSGEGMITVGVGPAALAAVGELPVASRVVVSIRAEEILLMPADEEGHAGVMSARNRLRGSVVEVEPHGPMVRLSLDCGFRLVALVTRQAFAELDARPGSELLAVVKAPAVHVVPVE